MYYIVLPDYCLQVHRSLCHTLHMTMTQLSPIVQVTHLTKSFGKTTIIDDLSFEVRRGETFGLLGSNGSGKTTIIRTLLGIYIADGGSLTINGHTYSPKNGEIIGYLPEERGLYRNETVLDVMLYFGELKGMSRKDAKTYSLEFLKKVSLADKAKTKLSKLSGGQQQKVQLGITMMNNPELLILDEPTKGFDPVNRRLLRSLIEERRAAGATIILVTHDMAEVEELCDRLILLKDGKAAAYGTVAEVRAAHGGKSIDDIFVDLYSYTVQDQPAEEEHHV